MLSNLEQLDVSLYRHVLLNHPVDLYFIYYYYSKIAIEID